MLTRHILEKYLAYLTYTTKALRVQCSVKRHFLAFVVARRPRSEKYLSASACKKEFKRIVRIEAQKLFSKLILIGASKMEWHENFAQLFPVGCKFVSFSSCWLVVCGWVSEITDGFPMVWSRRFCAGTFPGVKALAGLFQVLALAPAPRPWLKK